MDGKLPRNNRKRPYLDDIVDDDPNNAHKPKRVRFPKGKKLKPGDEAAYQSVVEDAPTDKTNPKLAARERAKRRNQITAELFDDEVNDASAAEVAYESSENFVEDGIQIEPFNLEKEREEGYFDAEGNFVEYVNENEIKDAWLDSVEIDPRYAGKSSAVTARVNEEDSDNDAPELSSEEIGMIKRRIANVLEPGETVLQALRRLKGGSDKKEKMSADTQLLFDQLTEDANKLMDHGDYDVYHDKQEVFQREAEGYERLAQARGKGPFLASGQENSEYGSGKDMFSSLMDVGGGSSTQMDTPNPNATTADTSTGADEYDMFADDDDNVVTNPTTDGGNLAFTSNSNEVSQPSSDGTNTISDSGALSNDYVFDESSGYYYSSSLGYYYDASTGLYCQASSGKWYSFNEETGTYDAVDQIASNAS